MLKRICGPTEASVKKSAERLGYVCLRHDKLEGPDCRSRNSSPRKKGPNNVHAQPCIAALEAGKHTIVEKPLAMNMAETRQMVAAAKTAEKKGIKSMVSFSNRFSPAVLLAKRLIEQGKISEVYDFCAAFLQDWLIDPVIFIQELGDRVLHVHENDGELVEHNVERSGLQPTGNGDRIDRGFRFRIPFWGSVPWKRLMTVLALVGYKYAVSYEHEDVVMSREDGIEKTIEFLRPLIIKGR